MKKKDSIFFSHFLLTIGSTDTTIDIDFITAFFIRIVPALLFLALLNILFQYIRSIAGKE